MPDIDLGKKQIIYGDEDFIEVEFWHNRGIDVSSATCTFDLYDSSETQLITARSMTVTGTKRCVASCKVSSGSGKDIATNPTAGTTSLYRGIATVDYNTQQPKKRYRVYIEVHRAPS
jgi:hypothetical protein